MKLVDGVLINCEVTVISPTEEQIAKEHIEQTKQISNAGRDYIAAHIDPDGMLLVDRLVRAGHPYGLACEQWLIGIRLEQYRRMAVVEARVEEFTQELLDFSVFGLKPYTIQQMLMVSGVL